MPIKITGVNETIRNLYTLAGRMVDGGDEFMEKRCKAILSRALEYCPEDSGDLKRSGEVKRTGGNVQVGVERSILARDAGGRFTKGSLAVAFGKGLAQAYALAVHETPSEHDPPTWQGKTVEFKTGGPKFLERAFREQTGNLDAALAAHLKGKLR